MSSKNHKSQYQKQYRIDNKDYLALYNKNYHKKYPWMFVFNYINNRCNNKKNSNYKYYGGRGIKCLITKEELKTLWFRDKAYLLKVPSINRKDNDGDYTFDNCYFDEQRNNIIEMNKRTKSKPILQFDLSGNFIKEWPSIIMASKGTNQTHANISYCVRGFTKTAGGYIWKFKVTQPLTTTT